MSLLDAAIQAFLAPSNGHADPLTDCLISQAMGCAPRRFFVSITRPDGTVENYQRTGGNSCDHVLEAAAGAGVGSVVRVVPLDTAAAA